MQFNYVDFMINVGNGGQRFSIAISPWTWTYNPGDILLTLGTRLASLIKTTTYNKNTTIINILITMTLL